MYYQAEHEPDPLESMKGPWIGMLADEVPPGWQITKFVSPAPKVYAIEMKNDKGNAKYVVKAKGLVEIFFSCHLLN